MRSARVPGDDLHGEVTMNSYDVSADRGLPKPAGGRWRLSVAVAQADALFASDLSASSVPSAAIVSGAIRRAVLTYGGTRGCAAEVAAAYGERPEIAVTRMRWARLIVEAVRAQPIATGPGDRGDLPARAAVRCAT